MPPASLPALVVISAGPSAARKPSRPVRGPRSRRRQLRRRTGALTTRSGATAVSPIIAISAEQPRDVSPDALGKEDVEDVVCRDQSQHAAALVHDGQRQQVVFA